MKYCSSPGMPGDWGLWACLGVLKTLTVMASPPQNLENLIGKSSSVLESPLDSLEVVAPRRRRRRRRTKLSLLVNDKHSDSTGQLHQWQATSPARVKEVLPSCSHQHRSSCTTVSVLSQHLTSAQCTHYNNAVKPSSHCGILQGIQGYVQY